MSTYIIILVVLILLSGFFSSAEISFFSLDEIRVDYLYKKKKKGSKKLKYLKDNPKKLLITILIGNNIVNILASSIATFLATEAFGSKGIGIATGIMTFLILIFGEIYPKSLATEHSEKIALFIAPIFYYLSIILSPLISILSGINTFLSKIFRLKRGIKPKTTEEEIQILADKAEQAGIIDTQELQLIKKSVIFNEKKVEEIMTPLSKIFFLNQDKKLRNVVDDIVESGFSRIPLYDEKKKRFTGVLYLKNILKKMMDREFHDERLKDFKEDILFIDHKEEIGKTFERFRKKIPNIALVVNDEKEVIGLVTLEDIVEELVGEIYDENERLKKQKQR